ncbi:MAG: hypothetical protein KGJ62_15690 [Armatimonadetes bacterium]|nr:hypothetical protein [Armatimonadota bacterium]MDE2207838.1 hypothetical protein [Armatimonadota bacterium]
MPTHQSPPALRYLLPLIAGFAVVGSAPAARAQTPQAAAPPGSAPAIRILKFKSLHYDGATGAIASSGDVTVHYRPQGSEEPVTLTTHSLNYTAGRGVASAPGPVTLTRVDGAFSGTGLQYDFVSGAGLLSHARLDAPGLHVTGARIQRFEDGSIDVINGTLTTCDRTNPDYHLRANRLHMTPQRIVSADHITLFAGRTALITLPYLRRNLNIESNAPTPLPGYDGQDGVTLRIADAPIQTRRFGLDYDLRFGVIHPPSGYVAAQTGLSGQATPAPRGFLPDMADPLRGFLEQLTPPTYLEYAASRLPGPLAPATTAALILENGLYVINRRRTDLRVARLPEIAIQASNLLGHGAPESTNGSQVQGASDLVNARAPGAPFLLNLDADLSSINETPTNAHGTRLDVRISAASQPLMLGRRISARAGISNWANAYSDGNLYDLVSPEVELNFLPTSTSLLDVGYRYLSDAGRTPFAFDRRDLRHELRLQYQVGGPWAFGIVSKMDMERTRFYDGELTVVRNFDCMQVGVAYRVRTRSVSIIFSLLPGALVHRK